MVHWLPTNPVLFWLYVFAEMVPVDDDGRLLTTAMTGKRRYIEGKRTTKSGTIPVTTIMIDSSLKICRRLLIRIHWDALNHEHGAAPGLVRNAIRDN